MPASHHRPYLKLAVMAVLSFIAMYVLMYAMVNEGRDVYPNINQLYMAGLMAAPMVIIELLVMRAMYPVVESTPEFSSHAWSRPASSSWQSGSRRSWATCNS